LSIVQGADWEQRESLTGGALAMKEKFRTEIDDENQRQKSVQRPSNGSAYWPNQR